MAKRKVACVQMDCKLGDVKGNVGRVVEWSRRAAERGAELVIFPECALTGYGFESLEEAAAVVEPLDGPSAATIAEACLATGLHAIVGFIERDGQKFYNAAMLVGPSGIIGSYRKVHLPFLGVDRFLTPGDRGFQVFDSQVGRIGLQICYDASFPEASRVSKLLGAELIVLPTNWPPEAWRTPAILVNARAQENHLNFAAVNRVGVERGCRFIGRSKVVDYNGDTICEAGEGEEMLLAEVDMERANDNHIVNQPGVYELDRLADRRPEFYALIAEGARPKRDS